MTGLVVQEVSSWEDWPDDVREKLRLWNQEWLLSFVPTGDFHCSGCDRQIKGHPQGNALVRPTKHLHGVARCEDCLVAVARAHEWPPELLPNDPWGQQAFSYRGALRRARRVETRLRERLAGLERRRERMRQQAALDQAYIRELEQLVPNPSLKEVRARMRSHPLNQRRRPA